MNSVASLPMSAWPTGRKVAAGVFALASLAALTCAAVYVSAVLFLVLNKANPRQAQFTSITHYWDLYADDATLRKKLVASIALSGSGSWSRCQVHSSPPLDPDGRCTATHGLRTQVR